MKDKLIYYAKETIIFILVMTLFANIISFYKSSDLNKEALPSLNVTLLDNSDYILTNNSKPILVHFWATWCPTCSLEAANIETLSKSFEVITIAVKSDRDKIIDYVLANDLNFKVVNDNEGVLARKFNISAYPTTFIYDKNAELVFSEVGYTSTFGLWLRMWWAGV